MRISGFKIILGSCAVVLTVTISYAILSSINRISNKDRIAQQMLCEQYGKENFTPALRPNDPYSQINEYHFNTSLQTCLMYIKLTHFGEGRTIETIRDIYQGEKILATYKSECVDGRNRDNDNRLCMTYGEFKKVFNKLWELN